MAQGRTLARQLALCRAAFESVERIGLLCELQDEQHTTGTVGTAHYGTS